MATKPPLDLFTNKEHQVASILLEVSSLILERALEVPLYQLKWGVKRRRTQPPYQFKSESGRSNPAGPTSFDEEKKRQEETTTSPVTPLCFPNSYSEEQIVTPPVSIKQVKKPYTQSERLKEKKEQIAVLTKEKTDFSKKLQELHERFQKLNAMKIYLNDQNSKWRALNQQLKPLGPTQTTNWNAYVVTPQWAPLPPPISQTLIERPRLELDLNEEPNDDVVEFCVPGHLTCQSDREDRVAKSAQARRRRLEIQRERKGSPSLTAQMRPRVR